MKFEHEDFTLQSKQCMEQTHEDDHEEENNDVEGGKTTENKTVKLATSAHFMLITAIFRASCLSSTLCELCAVCVWHTPAIMVWHDALRNFNMPNTSHTHEIQLHVPIKIRM